MKKFLMTMLAALVMTTAAEAQTVQRMVVKQTDGNTYKFNLSDVDEVTFEETAIKTPTTAEEAKQMFIGQWKGPAELGQVLLEEEAVEEFYLKFREDGVMVAIYCMPSLEMTIGEEYNYSIVPDSSDPTQGVISQELEMGYRDLNSEGFRWTLIGDDADEDTIFQFTRNDKPIEYVLMNDDE